MAGALLELDVRAVGNERDAAYESDSVVVISKGSDNVEMAQMETVQEERFESSESSASPDSDPFEEGNIIEIFGMTGKDEKYNDQTGVIMGRDYADENLISVKLRVDGNEETRAFKPDNLQPAPVDLHRGGRVKLREEVIPDQSRYVHPPVKARSHGTILKVTLDDDGILPVKDSLITIDFDNIGRRDIKAEHHRLLAESHTSPPSKGPSKKARGKWAKKQQGGPSPEQL